MKSLIVGAGFGSLYKNVLQGFSTVTMVDSNPEKNPDYLSIEAAIAAEGHFDTANICLPNYLHLGAATKIAGHADVIFVEKPGFKSALEWQLFNSKNSRICMVKNNMWRLQIPELRSMVARSDKIKINWINKDRVPSPGSWFTNKALAFGGVSRDLMPHLLSIFVALDSHYMKSDAVVTACKQRWKLSDLESSDYGSVNKNGVYDVDDFCSLGIVSLENKTWNLTADWRSNEEDQINIQFFNKSIEIGSFSLGLCPEYAYARMVLDCLANKHNNKFWEEQMQIDLFIHSILDELICK